MNKSHSTALWKLLSVIYAVYHLMLQKKIEKYNYTIVWWKNPIYKRQQIEVDA